MSSGEEIKTIKLGKIPAGFVAISFEPLIFKKDNMTIKLNWATMKLAAVPKLIEAQCQRN